MKLSVFYSNPLHFLRRLDEAGINAFVLFNRFFQPDVDPESESIVMPMNYSTAADSRLPLRFAGWSTGGSRPTCARALAWQLPPTRRR